MSGTDRFGDLLGLGGLDADEYLSALEHHFHVAIPDEDAVNIQTIGQLRDYLVGRLPSRADDSERVWSDIC